MKVLKKKIDELLKQDKLGKCDFHTHSFLSDGALLPMEQLRRAHVNNYAVYAITDHVGSSNMDVIQKLKKDCILATKHWGIAAIPGVELTHVPSDTIEELTQVAIDNGALIVVVHGETIVEPVEPGTNLAAAKCRNVDILAHPGLITQEEAILCKKNDIFVEITSNRNHALTNGHVAKIGKEIGNKLLFNTDTHKPQDMLTNEQNKSILLGTGLNEQDVKEILQKNTRSLLSKISERLD
ncbi:MAG: histidinol phosphate phosphatase domain-containing protein [Asgard group archaeon]|nr:histidinol phosphate phosphatase domain-containing protein [Asgard group archaeon]